MANDLTWFSDTRLVRKTLFSLWEVAPACCFNKPNDQTAPGEGGGGREGIGNKVNLKCGQRYSVRRNPLTCSRAPKIPRRVVLFILFTKSPISPSKTDVVFFNRRLD